MGWILAVLAGGLLTFNAVVTPDRAAGEATKALKKKFPGADVEVKIEGRRGKDVLNGRFESIEIRLANLSLDELPLQSSAAVVGSAAPNSGAPRLETVKTTKIKKPKLGRTDDLKISVRAFQWQKLPVERAEFNFENVEYDFGALKHDSQFKLVRTGHATMHLELAPDALTPFVARRVANVSRPALAVRGDQLVVTGAREFYGIAAPFELRGKPGFSGSQVILNETKLSVSGLPVPALVATPLLQSVNPLYSFSELKDLPFKVKLTKVEARDGKLQVDGDLTLR